MKHYLFFIFLLPIIFSCSESASQGSTSADWKEIQSENGNFKISFPDYEVKETQETSFDDGKKVTAYAFTAQPKSGDDNLGYRVDYTFVKKAITEDEIDYGFERQKRYVLDVGNARLINELVIDKKPFPGRELYISLDDMKLRLYYRMYYHNGIFYKLMVITPEEKIFNKSIRKFFDSFEVLDLEKK